MKGRWGEFVLSSRESSQTAGKLLSALEQQAQTRGGGPLGGGSHTGRRKEAQGDLHKAMRAKSTTTVQDNKRAPRISRRVNSAYDAGVAFATA
jgi:hypothetical protein